MRTTDPVDFESRSSPLQLSRLQQDILAWFDGNQRDLPWRKTRDPYRILVSEVMLQQTQVDRVIPYYHRFLDAFPSIDSLASASPAEVIGIWSGLGYNRRAVNLQRAAQQVMTDHGGQFPRRMEEIRKLPGVGDYTAGAVSCFAFGDDVAFLDTNMRRVVERVFVGPTTLAAKPNERENQGIARQLVPRGEGWRWNQALMEFGALQCTARNPACLLCPARDYCLSAGSTFARDNTGDGAGARNERFEGSRRYYRGLIVKSLHGTTGEVDYVNIDDLGQQIRDDYSSELRPWLYEMVQGLARDGLAQVDESDATYDASPPATLRVGLPGI